tara:strand:+ start:10 stop:693 length:684 start_codon:yes stop_codon:yes gene_type:complete
MDKKILILTFYISIIIQIISGIISFYGIFIKLDKEDKILNDVLVIETLVQIVEGLFYIYIILAINKIKNNTITNRRYIDWTITTPIMLISTVLFMEYMKSKKEGFTTSTKKIFQEKNKSITKIVLYNFGMLLFGYLGEINYLNKIISISIGFVFFSLSFYEIWDNFGNKTEKTKKLFYFLIIIWGLYGIAAMYPVIPKNIMYNCLDIVSKNFYGLYIFYEILKVRNN